MLIPAILAFLFALTCSLLYGPLVRHWAVRSGLVDHPDSNRKMQPESVSLGGGLVVYLSLVTVMVAVFLLPNPWDMTLWQDWPDVVGFALACSIVVGVGLVDDRFGLRGRHKLLGQMVAASCVMIFSDLVVYDIQLFGQPFELGPMAIPFTMFWLLGAMNAINLLDGIDGLATLLGIILTATIAALAWMNSFMGVALIAIVLTGSLTGFLRYNLPPARMYLGDAGSMLIGLLVGSMAIHAMLKGPGTVLLAAPLAIWAIPIMDSGAAILRRRLTGRSLFMTDRGHLHHRLLEVLGSNAKVLIVVGACCVATSAGALVSVWAKNDLIAVIVCAAVVAMLVVTGMFGRAELRLLVSRVTSVMASLGHPTDLGGVARQSKVRLQGKQQWELLWETLTESADKLRLIRVHLDVNAPALHESFVATWESPGARNMERCWRLQLPLAVGNMQVGWLDVRGCRNGGSELEEISELIDLLEPFQTRLAAITNPPVVSERELVDTLSE